MTAIGIGGLAVVVASLVVWMIGRASAGAALVAAVTIALLMAAQIAAADSGLLRQWDWRPPPFTVLVGAMIGVTLVLALSPLGRRMAATLSFATLVGVQAFRLPLELVMHHAATIGLMPVQMSYSGRNFDILTGLTAIPVAWLCGRTPVPRRVVLLWNIAGAVLLANIVSVAVASLPMFAAFGPDRLNTWVADPPYIWLPGVLVPAALFGHLLVFRKLRGVRS